MTDDPFQNAIRRLRPKEEPKASQGHGGRAHSKFAASAMERIEACPGSVALSEGLPDQSNKYSLLGTRAHEILEAMLRIDLEPVFDARNKPTISEGAVIKHLETLKFRYDPRLEGNEAEQRKGHRDMLIHARTSADYILGLAQKHDASILVEQRVYLKFIHPEMFGTFDAAVLDYFGTLYVYDFKYGEGKGVSPTKNMQALFYGIALADKLDWNFERVRLIIDQPRLKGYDGPVYWECSVDDLQKIWVPKFRAIVERTVKNPELYIEGAHCHWCKAKKICPLKNERRVETAKNIFAQAPIQFDGSEVKEYS